MMLSVEDQFSKETVAEFLSYLTMEDLAKIKDKVELICLSTQDEMARKLSIRDGRRLSAWKDHFKPLEQEAEPIKNFLKNKLAAAGEIIKYYEANMDSLEDMRTVEGQKRFGAKAKQTSCSLIFHCTNAVDAAIAPNLAEMFLVLAKALNSGRLESELTLSLSFRRFSPEQDSRIKIFTETTVTGDLLRQIYEILGENRVARDVFHVKVVSEVSVVMRRYFDPWIDYQPFEPLHEGMLHEYEELANEFEASNYDL
ncbi:unnamed protein product, partial [Mesorhabditis spiculigera]